MGETCRHCGRRTMPSDPSETECGGWRIRECRIAAAAYHRGIAAGLALAKEHAFASVGYQHGYPTAHIEWHEVDAAAKSS